MDVNKIKEIVNNNDYTDEGKQKLIFDVLSEDDTIIPNLLRILQAERLSNEKMIKDYNVELSMALVTLEDKNLGTAKAFVELDFIIGRIRSFFIKWKHKIRPSLKIKGLD